MSAWSVLSVGSLLCFGSAGSAFSIGSVGSVLSIGSSGSVLSIGSMGSVLSIGSAGGFLSLGHHRRRTATQPAGDQASPLRSVESRLSAPANSRENARGGRPPASPSMRFGQAAQ